MPRYEFTDEDRLRAFYALIRHAGDVKATLKDLKEDDVLWELDRDLLLDWRDRTHSALYVTLSGEQGRAMEEMAKTRMRENTLGAVQLEGELIEKIREEAKGAASIEALSRALDAVQKARSSSVDKTLSLDGRPVDGKGALDPHQIVRELARMGVAIIEGSATEEPPELEAGDDPD